MYADVVEESYRFNDASYQALARAEVPWPDAIHILRHARPRVRHHIGAVLRLAAPTTGGRWLAIACIEETDDTYLVVGARWLDDAEAEHLRKTIEGG